MGDCDECGCWPCACKPDVDAIRREAFEDGRRAGRAEERADAVAHLLHVAAEKSDGEGPTSRFRVEADALAYEAECLQNGDHEGAAAKALTST